MDKETTNTAQPAAPAPTQGPPILRVKTGAIDASDASGPIEKIRQTLWSMLTSKKFLAILAAGMIVLAGWVARAAGADVDQGTLDRVLLALLAYVGAQGVADLGKGAAEARAMAAAASPPSSLRSVLIELLTSKKFLASVAAGLVALVGPIAQRIGVSVDPAELDRLFVALLAYVGAQGVADLGKGAAQVNTTVKKTESAPPTTRGGRLDESTTPKSTVPTTPISKRKRR